jgi:hypothetical protein
MVVHNIIILYYPYGYLYYLLLVIKIGSVVDFLNFLRKNLKVKQCIYKKKKKK